MSEVSFIDFLPISEETVEDIISRMDADVNAGVDPNDSAFTDATEGGFYADLRTMSALELERLKDYASTVVPAVMFPALAFGDYLDEWGVTLDVERKDEVKATGEVTFEGTDGTFVATGTEVATEQVSADEDPISFVTTSDGTITGGDVTLPVEAVVAGATGNVAIGAISVPVSPVSGPGGEPLTLVTNAEATSGGADIESDALYRSRLLLEFQPGQGAGTIADYEKWALDYDPVGYATVVPLASGPGTVELIVSDQDNNPVSGTVLTGLKALLDPVDGEGRGLAPIGAIVTVVTVTITTVDVDCNVTLLSGYTFDGAGGTIPVRADIEAALAAYINTLKPGDDVILERVSATFFSVNGVFDVATVLLNGAATNTAIGATAVARLDVVTLT